MTGLVVVGLPVCYFGIGGYEVLQATLPDNFFILSAISWQQIVNWFITIVPIWFIYTCACRDIFKKKKRKRGLLVNDNRGNRYLVPYPDRFGSSAGTRCKYLWYFICRIYLHLTSPAKNTS